MAKENNMHSFTNSAVKLYDKFKEKDNKLFAKLSEENDVRGFIEYLENENNTVNFNYALMRYIFDKFFKNGNKDIDINEKYIFKMTNHNGEPKVFEVYPYEAVYEKEDNEYEYDEFINEYACVFSALRDVNGLKDYISNTTLKSYLMKARPTRNKMFVIGFILNMDDKDVISFLKEYLGEDGYNIKDGVEMIYYFCHKNHLSYDESQKMIEEYENAEVKKIEKNKVDKNTIFIRNNIRIFDKDDSLDKETFISLLKENKSILNKVSSTRIKNSEKLVNRIKKIIQIIDDKDKDISASYLVTFLDNSAYLKRETTLPNIFGNNLRKHDFPNISKLGFSKRKHFIYLYFNLYFLIYENIDKLLNNEKIEEDDILKGLVKDINEIKGKIALNSKNVDRQTIDTFELLENFRGRIDNELDELNYGTLNFRNNYDNLILLCICHKDPRKMYNIIRERSLKN